MEYEGKWTQVKVTVPLEDRDDLIAIMSMQSNNLMIEDMSDIDLSTCYGDLIDESILNADKTKVSVSLFLPEDRPCNDTVSFIRERMNVSGINGEITLGGVREEDWANSWKAYYKTLHIGHKIVIVPAWEAYTPKEGELIVRMDPGMAFGTGTHETTRLVIRLLEENLRPGDRVLDVGCGSGILSICAAKLGAATVAAYDIDPMAVRVARENVEESGERNITCAVSDLLRDVSLAEGPFDLICANIVADIIIRMAPDVGRYLKEGGILLASGIITERAEEVAKALADAGLRIKERRDDNGWCALVVTR